MVAYCIATRFDNVFRLLLSLFNESRKKRTNKHDKWNYWMKVMSARELVKSEIQTAVERRELTNAESESKRMREGQWNSNVRQSDSIHSSRCRQYGEYWCLSANNYYEPMFLFMCKCHQWAHRMITPSGAQHVFCILIYRLCHMIGIHPDIIARCM